MLRGWFAPFGPIDSILINYSKFNCFLKLRTRRQAHAALQANIPHLKLNWGCGFGHKAFFHYGTGTSVLNLKALGANAAFLMTTTVGGIRHGCLRGGLTVEEPDLDFKVYRKFRDMK
ncbi:hypothetical protein HMI54_007478 [Coelomomyces lativittatus]|nr:hypothetical protein HMI54_007478 [Coelomomyces lativittatus]KAJ1506615.1 hypothetical protein HMI56_000521 [Coelomomyces lativittatus]KAJ1513339.1 hypothetical protein HMI55_005678 [Coelomomyces lativittatus]